MSEARRSPLVAQVVLLVVFLAIAVVGALTVFLPEISDAGDEDEATAQQQDGAAPSDADDDDAD